VEGEPEVPRTMFRKRSEQQKEGPAAGEEDEAEKRPPKGRSTFPRRGSIRKRDVSRNHTAPRESEPTQRMQLRSAQLAEENRSGGAGQPRIQSSNSARGETALGGRAAGTGRRLARNRKLGELARSGRPASSRTHGAAPQDTGSRRATKAYDKSNARGARTSAA